MVDHHFTVVIPSAIIFFTDIIFPLKSPILFYVTYVTIETKNLNFESINSKIGSW
jgi:hypothetical protein